MICSPPPWWSKSSEVAVFSRRAQTWARGGRFESGKSVALFMASGLATHCNRKGAREKSKNSETSGVACREMRYWPLKGTSGGTKNYFYSRKFVIIQRFYFRINRWVIQ